MHIYVHTKLSHIWVVTAVFPDTRSEHTYMHVIRYAGSGLLGWPHELTFTLCQVFGI